MIQMQGGTVTCGNYTTSTANELRGRATLISNMTSAPVPSFTDDILTGATRNDTVLRSTAPYSAGVQSPLIPQLQGGAATGGFTESTFWNQSQVTPPGVDLLELAALRGTSSVFQDFDQIFLVNNGGADAENVVLTVQGFAPYAIGTIPDGEIWTTCVPTGAVVSFSVALEVSIIPASLDLYTGETLTLTANTVGGLGTKNYHWLRNGDEVQTGPSNVYAKAAALTDEGMYTVEVTDDIQTVTGTNSVPVTVDDPVVMTQDPTGATLITGGTHVFTVSAQGGKGALTYTWRKNGWNLGAPSNSFLAVGPVVAGDAGFYDVIVTDTIGVAPNGRVTSAVATLTVNSPLSVAGPVDVSVYEDTASVQFEVLASGGIPSYNYVWYKDGFILPPGAQPGSDTLVLSAPLSGQEGDYSCVVSDSDTPPDTQNSAEGRLTLYPHLSITTHPQDAALNPGQNVVFAVVAEGGVPLLSYTWRKNGTPIDQLPDPISQPSGPVLTITGVTESHEGNYDVVVKDGGTDTIVSNAASLRVRNVPLLFVVHPQGTAGYIDEGSYTMTALATGGDGAIHYRWWHDDGGGAVVVGGDSTSYTITTPAIALSGTYWCEADDDPLFPEGSITSQTAEVMFGERLNFTENPVSATRYLDEGGYTMTIATTGGIGAITYAWRFDGGAGPVTVGSGLSYSITTPQLENSGAYWCEATDAVGTWPSVQAMVIFGEHLQFTQLPVGTERYLDEGNYTMTVATTGGLGSVSYVWKFDNGSGPVDIGTGLYYTITDPALGDSGAYSCLARDSRGEEITAGPVEVLFGNHMTFAESPVGGVVREGDYWRFFVRVDGGLGTVSYEWQFDRGAKNFVPVGGNSPEYILNSVSEEDEGDYQVVVHDAREIKPSGIVHLTVTAGVPAAGLGGLVALVFVCAAAGAAVVRKRK